MTCEQPYSAHDMLDQAGVLHGDTTEVIVATGAIVKDQDAGPPVVHAMFCSGVAQVGRVIKRGSRRDHRLPIQGDIEIVATPKNCELPPVGSRVVALLRGRVFTNGHVAFDFDNVTLVPVSAGDQANLHHNDGRTVCRRVLQEALAS